MNRINLVAIALVSALTTPLVVNAAGRIEPVKPIVVAEAAVATVAQAEPASPAPSDGCARRVRVVYPSYQAAAAGACAAPISTK